MTEVGVGDVTNVSKAFFGKYGSSSLEKGFFFSFFIPKIFNKLFQFTKFDDIISMFNHHLWRKDFFPPFFIPKIFNRLFQFTKFADIISMF